jgi:hypothetical protein
MGSEDARRGAQGPDSTQRDLIMTPSDYDQAVRPLDQKQPAQRGVFEEIMGEGSNGWMEGCEEEDDIQL